MNQIYLNNIKKYLDIIETYNILKSRKDFLKYIINKYYISNDVAISVYNEWRHIHKCFYH